MSRNVWSYKINKINMNEKQAKCLIKEEEVAEEKVFLNMPEWIEFVQLFK